MTMTAKTAKSGSAETDAPSKKAKAKPKAAKAKTKAAKTATSKGSKATKNAKQLVVVESPAKARTIERYLGPDFVVKASVGHIRDLPSRAPKGVKQPVPGVDLENNFAPSYEILKDKTKAVNDLKKAAKGAKEIWFATDLDREGEAIAWHLAEILNVEASQAKRVVFNAITKKEIERAFSHPRAIDTYRVNAQQARRILDRIVGYQVSPLLWKKVARGLSAGRVQSVAVRLVVDRERAIEAFTPDELWKVTARLALDPAVVSTLTKTWSDFMAKVDDRGKGATVKAQNAWLAENAAVRTELVELGGKKFELGCKADKPVDLSAEITEVAAAVGMTDVVVHTTIDPDGKGPAKHRRTVSGGVGNHVRYSVRNIETKRTSSKPPGPFITSSLQIAASNQLGFSARRTMRLAQNLYEGVELGKDGQVGLITYMRTDSTHIADEAMAMVRGYIEQTYGGNYLSEKPLVYTSSNKAAQEAHEAVRPTDVSRHPDAIKPLLKGDRAEDQYKLYKLIWSRFVACQMAQAKWDSTSIMLERSDQSTGAVLKLSGRTLVFPGFYDVSGVPTSSDEQTLPELGKGDELAPFTIEPSQRFTSPPPRYSEASLVKALESEGIGRPSTYASIIQVIQDRSYVEQVDRRFYATDLGEVVTDKLVEAFPHLLDVGYTRSMEAELDKVEENHTDWVAMLRNFYTPFSEELAAAHEELTHAKAEIQAAPFACPDCGSRTCYRFGKNGRFLSCTAYPDCTYAAPIDRQGRPLLPEKVDVVCPEDSSEMELRKGRFGPFLASTMYPKTKFVLNLDRQGQLKYPAIPPLPCDDLRCPKCDSPMNLRRGKRGPWLGCSTFPKCRGRMGWAKLEETQRDALDSALAKHEAANPQPEIKRRDGTVIPEGTPVATLLIEGGVAELAHHPQRDEPLVLDLERPAPEKKSASKKSTSKKSATKKSTSKNSATKKSTSKKSATKKKLA